MARPLAASDMADRMLALSARLEGVPVYIEHSRALELREQMRTAAAGCHLGRMMAFEVVAEQPLP